jgi:hypothetical protein
VLVLMAGAALTGATRSTGVDNRTVVPVGVLLPLEAEGPWRTYARRFKLVLDMAVDAANEDEVARF